MTLEKRDWWWIIGLSVVCSGLDKRGWSDPGSALVGALVGACLGLLISRLTKRRRAG
jgi:uncharacterized membrane protein YjjB (DUF3815 family)